MLTPESKETPPWIGLTDKGPVLVTWNAICRCVGQKHSRQVRKWMIEENERTEGPIRREGRKVRVFTNPLKVWWSDVDQRLDVAEKREQSKHVLDVDHPLELDAAGLRIKVKKPRRQ